jgi:uncharacterized protein YukE
MATSFPYDTAKFSIDPQTVNAAAKKITSLSEDVANQIGNINEAISDLQLSWTGGAADIAAQVNTEWQNAVTALFGTQQDPDKGILPSVADGLTDAAQNYISADIWVSTAFENLGNNLLSAQSGSSAGSGPQSVLNSGNQTGSNALTAITETFPSS